MLATVIVHCDCHRNVLWKSSRKKFTQNLCFSQHSLGQAAAAINFKFSSPRHILFAAASVLTREMFVKAFLAFPLFPTRNAVEVYLVAMRFHCRHYLLLLWMRLPKSWNLPCKPFQIRSCRLRELFPTARGSLVYAKSRNIVFIFYPNAVCIHFMTRVRRKRLGHLSMSLS